MKIYISKLEVKILETKKPLYYWIVRIRTYRKIRQINPTVDKPTGLKAN